MLTKKHLSITQHKIKPYKQGYSEPFNKDFYKMTTKCILISSIKYTFSIARRHMTKTAQTPGYCVLCIIRKVFLTLVTCNRLASH